MRNHNFSFVILLAIAFMSCNEKKTINSTVQHRGALMNLMSGNLEATASLDSLETLPHLYALGALENLDGEIQIFDSESYVSKTDINNSVKLENNFNHKASLLVYAQVSEWSDGIELDTFNDNSNLEKQIKRLAIQQGINVNRPFPFLLKGTGSTLNWHVIQWPEGDMDHTHKKHRESGAHGVLENKEVEIIGFYSEKHKAVFTHHTTFLHMHFKTENKESIAGHVDGISGEDLKLYLPQL